MTQKPKMNLEQRYNHDLQETLSTMEFSFDPTLAWVSAANVMMFNTSINFFACTAKQYAELVKAIKTNGRKLRLTYLQFAQINNTLQAKSPDELGMELAEYSEVMLECAAFAETWNKTIQPIADEIQGRLQEELRKDVANDLQQRNLEQGGPGKFGNIKAEA